MPPVEDRRILAPIGRGALASNGGHAHDLEPIAAGNESAM